MTRHAPLVFDYSAMIDLFAGHRVLGQMLDAAERGDLLLLFPTVSIAQAESEIHVGLRLWRPFLLTHGVRSIALPEHVAIEAGSWPAPILVGQVVHEALSV